MDIDAVKAVTSLADVVESYLGPPEIKSGRWRKNKCPFHDDSTPSFAYTDNNGKWFCFGCGLSGDVLDFVQRMKNVDLKSAIEILTPGNIDPVELARRQADRAKREADRAADERRKLEAVIAQMQAYEPWRRYHEQLDEQARKWWRREGIPNEFQDFWSLGWCPNYSLHTDSGEHFTPTATIPVYEVGWKPVNVRHRLINPPAPGDKYRPERPGLPTMPFLADPDKAPSGHVVVVEGEKKAMVVYLTLDDPDVQVVGLPGLNSAKSAVELLADAERLTVILDPIRGQQQRQAAWSMIETLGRDRCRVLTPPMKIDDGIRLARIDKGRLAGMLRQAVPV